MRMKQLSELEQEVMNIVWELDECSVRNVLQRINKNRNLAYTTVATILQRLHEKGLVERKSDGIAFLYSPKLSKESYSKNLVQSFINKFFASFGDVAVASFAQSIDKLPKRKKEYILELLDTYSKTE